MTPRPLIAHVIHSLETGGLENGVVNLVNHGGPEFRHAIVCMSTAGSMRSRLDPSVPVVTVGKASGNDPRAFVRLVKLLRQLRPSVVHTRNWAAFDAVPGARLAGVHRVVHSEHGREFADPEGRNTRRNRIRWVLAPLVTHFVTVSDDLRRWLLEEVRLPARKISTIYNGVDLGRFGLIERRAARERLGVASDALVIGTVGRLDPVKDQAALLRALAALLPRYPDAWLLIVGDGPGRDDLVRLARELRVETRVSLLGERRDVPIVLAAMDVFALPSIAEGMSNTVLEAMASGLPVVATRVGGNPELVADGVTGRLVSRSDLAALGTALADYLDEPHLRAIHGKAARQRAADYFGLDRMCEAYLAVYRRVVAGRAGEAA